MIEIPFDFVQLLALGFRSSEVSLSLENKFALYVTTNDFTVFEI